MHFTYTADMTAGQQCVKNNQGKFRDGTFAANKAFACVGHGLQIGGRSVRQRLSGPIALFGYAGTILVSFPDASNNNVGDHANDRGTVSASPRAGPWAACLANAGTT